MVTDARARTVRHYRGVGCTPIRLCLYPCDVLGGSHLRPGPPQSAYALAAAGRLPSEEAVRRLVTVTLAGLRPSTP